MIPTSPIPIFNSPSFHALLQMGNESLTSGMNSEVVSNHDTPNDQGNQITNLTIERFKETGQLLVGPKYEYTSSTKNMNLYHTPLKMRVFQKSVLNTQKSISKDHSE